MKLLRENEYRSSFIAAKSVGPNMILGSAQRPSAVHLPTSMALHMKTLAGVVSKHPDFSKVVIVCLRSMV